MVRLVCGPSSHPLDEHLLGGVGMWQCVSTGRLLLRRIAVIVRRACTCLPSFRPESQTEHICRLYDPENSPTGKGLGTEVCEVCYDKDLVIFAHQAVRGRSK